MDNRIKQAKTELGTLEMRFLAYVQMRKMDVVRTGDIAKALNLSSKQERELLSRLSRSGMIIRLKRGAYLVPPRLPAGGRMVSPIGKRKKALARVPFFFAAALARRIHKCPFKMAA